MINFQLLEENLERYQTEFNNNFFGFVAIDNFLDQERAERLLAEFPDPLGDQVNKSRDYIFARNKFEKSDIASHGPDSAELLDDLLSDRFEKIIQTITNEKIFIDPKFHGGGFHQGGKGSFLDMHADFNVHPLNPTWHRKLNILIYMNKGWKPEWKGNLKLRDARSGEKAEIEPLFNRAAIMQSSDFTLHGYDPIDFPEGQYRRSIAVYGYKYEDVESELKPRSTTWYPEESGFLKRRLGVAWPTLVALKNKLFGSNTSKNG